MFYFCDVIAEGAAARGERPAGYSYAPTRLRPMA